MISFSRCLAQPRSGRGMRSWSVAALSCGALLLPAGSALAEDMPGMANGMACPHASGEGPDALAAAGPSEPTTPERAPSESPLGPAGGAPPSPPPSTPATKPASTVTRPATHVAGPATQVQAQRPATTAGHAAPAKAVARGTVRAVASSAVASSAVRDRRAAPRRVEQPRARRPAERARTAHRSTPARRFNGLEPRQARSSTTEPRQARSSTTVADPVVAKPRARAASPRQTRPSPAVLLGLLGLAAVGAAVVVLRRRRDRASYVDALVEAELHEMISEENARRLLSRSGQTR